MIISKERLVSLVFVLAVTLAGTVSVHVGIMLGMRGDVKTIAEGVVACGDLDARIHRLENPDVQ